MELYLRMPRIPGTNIRIGPTYGHGHGNQAGHHHPPSHNGRMPGHIMHHGGAYMAFQDFRGAVRSMGHGIGHVFGKH